MTTLAALIAERRARIESFERDTRDNAVHDICAVHNICDVNDKIERTPIVSKADALAALELIRDDILLGQHMTVAMVAALRAYIEG